MRIVITDSEIKTDFPENLKEMALNKPKYECKVSNAVISLLTELSTNLFVTEEMREFYIDFLAKKAKETIKRMEE